MDAPVSNTTFSIQSCTGKMTSLNTRKENHGEEKVLAVDIKLEVNCGIEISDSLLGADDKKASHFLDSLYGDDGSLVYWSIGNITFATDFEDCDVNLDNMKIKGCKLSKFSIHPKDQKQCVLTFNASYQPGKDQLEKLADLLMRDFKVTASPPPDLFDDQPDD